MEPQLLSECADWIAEMLNEDGFWISAELIEEILRKEHDTGIKIPPLTHEQAADQLAGERFEGGPQGSAGQVDRNVILQVLQWEDDFLGFAGRPRN